MLADTNKRIQDKVEEMEKIKSEYNETIPLTNLSHDAKSKVNGQMSGV